MEPAAGPEAMPEPDVAPEHGAQPPVPIDPTVSRLD
jgi:hypothetical protein